MSQPCESRAHEADFKFTGTYERANGIKQRDAKKWIVSLRIKSVKLYILGETTPSIAHLRWHSENYFQWTALIYIIIEAHHRVNTPETSSIWTLINRVCELHPELTTAVEFPEVYAIARLIVLAWQQRQECLHDQQKHVGKPWCVDELERALSICEPAPDGNGLNPSITVDDFDFDMIDWSFWETAQSV